MMILQGMQAMAQTHWQTHWRSIENQKNKSAPLYCLELTLPLSLSEKGWDSHWCKTFPSVYTSCLPPNDLLSRTDFHLCSLPPYSMRWWKLPVKSLAFQLALNLIGMGVNFKERDQGQRKYQCWLYEASWVLQLGKKYITFILFGIFLQENNLTGRKYFCYKTFFSWRNIKCNAFIKDINTQWQWQWTPECWLNLLKYLQ